MSSAVRQYTQPVPLLGVLLFIYTLVVLLRLPHEPLGELKTSSHKARAERERSRSSRHAAKERDAGGRHAGVRLKGQVRGHGGGGPPPPPPPPRAKQRPGQHPWPEAAAREEAEVEPEAPPDGDGFPVSSVEPAHGPRGGGTVVLVRGDNFGEFGEHHLQVLVGRTPCEETRWLSSTALHCMVPPGKGQHLAVRVVSCECPAAGFAAAGFGRGLRGVHAAKPFTYIVPELREQKQLEEEKEVVRHGVHFSYDEDVLAMLMYEDPPVRFKGPDVTLQVHKGKVDGYEFAFTNHQNGEVEHYGIEPSMLHLLPGSDMKAKHSTCAVVGTSGSLLGSKLGSVIDKHHAVFRVDAAPSGYKYTADVGRKTAYQVVGNLEAEALVGMRANAPHVARWWSDIAAVVLWETVDQQHYSILRNLYPDAAVHFLSPDLIVNLQNQLAVLKARIERELKVRYPFNVEDVSSLTAATALAMHLCQKVDVYGVFPRCGKHAHKCRLTYFQSQDTDAPPRFRMLADFEQKVMIGMGQAGFVNATTPVKIMDDGTAIPHPSLAKAPKLRYRVCDKAQCAPACVNGQVVNGTCQCETVYAGPQCAEDLIQEKVHKIFERIDVTYQGDLIMSQRGSQRRKLTPAGLESDDEEYFIPLPNGISRNKTEGDFYKFDALLHDLLPEDEGWLTEGLVRHYSSLEEPPPDFKRAPREQKLGTCAVVGNSGASLLYTHGREIDSHDVVYRFNQAPTRRFTDYVGTRCTHESLNSAWIKQLLEGSAPNEKGERNDFFKFRRGWDWRDEDATLLLFELFDPASHKFKNPDQIEYKERWWKKNYIKLRRRHPDRKVILLSPKFMSWAYLTYERLKERFEDLGLGRFAGEKPMSGFYAILFLYQVCDELDIYGFTPYKEADRLDPMASKYHYFDGAVPRHNSHSFDFTQFIYKALSYRDRRVVLHS